MTASLDYIPPEDTKFNDFQANLKTYIDAHTPATPQPWGYAQARVDILTALKTTWDAAWAIAKNKGTRNPGNVQAKDDARKAYEKEIRQFVREFLKNNLLITNEQRVDMGIPVPDTTPTPVPAVDFPPLIAFEKIGNNLQTLRFRNPQTPDSDAMPLKQRVELWQYVGNAGLADNSITFVFIRDTGKHLYKVTFLPAQKAQTAYYRARYKNPTGDVGPWSDVVSELVL